MKTTLMIDDVVMVRLKERAARERTTISALVEAALRLLLDPGAEPERKLPPLPSYHGGALLVDVSDREATYRILDEEKAYLYGGAAAHEPAVPYGAGAGRKKGRGARRRGR